MMHKKLLKACLAAIAALALAAALAFVFMPRENIYDESPRTTFLSTGLTAWAVDNTGQLWTWGRTTDHNAPVMILGDVVSIGFGHALTSNNSLWCLWSDNEPELIMENVTFFDHGMAITEDAELWTWGRNLFGTLGDGTTNDRGFPVKIKSDVAYATGFNSRFAIDTSGALWACAY